MPCQSPPQLAQQRPIGADARQQRLGLHARPRGLGQDDTHGAPSPEVDHDGLPGLDVAKGGRYRIGEGLPAGNPGGIDRDLDEARLRHVLSDADATVGEALVLGGDDGVDLFGGLVDAVGLVDHHVVVFVLP